MADSDETSDMVSYREVISRDPPWWVVTLYGPHLPEEGVSARSRTKAELSEAVYPLYPPAAPSSFSTEIEYDFGPAINAKLEGSKQAQIALREAWRNYHDLGRQITTALASEQDASLSEIADIIHEPYSEVARLRSYEPPESRLVHFHSRGLRHFLNEHAAPSITRAAAWGTRQARVIASDALHEARHSRFTHRA